MRNFSVLTITVLVLSGIVLAQTKLTVLEEIEVSQRLRSEPQCKAPDDAFYRPEAVVLWNEQSYRCSYIYDSWLARTGRVAWVKVRP